ncbi:MAG: right-handed parallel beta-helix repeat-containing protein [Saprospiraceae bacterium]|nr:right-handed parallel beta-helix repeat-containing protein [Saprospiraceae bacterium]MDW8230685.1 right-handed parallel beta-helix repeat-containing protein [Saprospiraceae bacterium]
MFARLCFLFLGTIAALMACQKERFTTNPSDRLGFSTDTLRFDTVFTSLGSATRILKVYNPNKRESIRISRIYLENGAQSRFRLNVDGLPGAVHNDVEIAPGDSLYIFAEVTINPDEPPSVSPFVITENLVFETNGNIQKVVLEAWGQNAVYLPSRFGKGGAVLYACNGGEWVWDDPRPYVIYGIVVIDSCTVRIPAGARVHVHGGLARTVQDSTVVRYNDGLIVFQGAGRLIVEGSAERPVIFEGDRLEREFANVSGQWTGLWLRAGTSGHRIEHAILRNSIIGVRVDSAADLTLRNAQIVNTSNSGLIGVHARIRAENCLFHSNGAFAIQLEYGGDYEFAYCTAANFGGRSEALRMGNALCYDPQCAQYDAFPLRARLLNCILLGSRPDQITLFNRTGQAADFDYRFEHCLVRVRDLLRPNAWPDFLNYCQPCLNLSNTDSVFLNIPERNFRLDTLFSKANGYARPIPGINTDLTGAPRDPDKPDAGCYERQ